MTSIYRDHVSVLNTSDGKTVARIPETAYAYGISPDGDRLVTSSYEGHLKLWNARTGVQIANLLEMPAAVGSITLSSNGLLALQTLRNKLELRRTSDGAILWSRTNGAGAFIAFSPQGDRLFTGFDDHYIRVWRTSDHALLLQKNAGPLSTMAVSHNGEHIAYRVADWIHIIRSSDGEQESLIWAPMSGSIAFSSNDRYIIAASRSVYDANLRMFRVSDGTLVDVWIREVGDVNQALAVSGDDHVAYGRTSGSVIQLTFRD